MRGYCWKLLAGLALLCSWHAAHALNPDIRLEDLNRTSWTQKDGVPSDIQSMAQTRDGWLWLGTPDGLYRFDGVTFERYPLKLNQVLAMHALDNGDLLVSFSPEGLLIVHANGKVTELSSPPRQQGAIRAMDMDRSGAIWAATFEGVYRHAGGKWETVATGPDWADSVQNVTIDQYDRVWASTRHALYRYDREAKKLLRVEGQGMGGRLLQSPDGRLWAVDDDRNLRPVPTPAQGQQMPRLPDFNQSESREVGQFDRDGNLWMLLCPQGICRVARAGSLPNRPINPAQQATDRLDQAWQLTDIATSGMLEDREGNLWVSTRSGLDRFRENKLIPARIAGASGELSVTRDDDGKLWLADWATRGIWTIGADGVAVRDPHRSGISLARDRDGAVLIAGTRDIERIYQGKSSNIALPAPGGKPVDLTVLGVLDDGKTLWMAALQTSLMGLKDGRWLPRGEFKLPQRIYMSAAGGPGQLWLSHNDGALTLYDNGNSTRYDIAAVGLETGIFPGQQLVVGGERGIVVMRDNRFVQLGPLNAEALRMVSGMAVTPDGDRWLNGARGLVHIRRGDWENSVRQPSIPLVYELIDALEGYPGRAAVGNRQTSVYNMGNGVLWLRATGGLVRLDTNALRANTVKPIVQLLRVNTDQGAYPATAVLHLPPDSHNFNIQYTAPGLRKPEGMQFQYKLDGVDQQWQDAGTRRAAYYTNVGPGRYNFSVRAANEDGMASDVVASMQIEIAPTVVQTWWFQLLCLALALLALYGAWRYRLQKATAAIASQLQVRMDERERIARTLHDTFLQSVQALVLRVYSVLTKLPEGSEPRTRLEAILDEADRAIEEGRDQVQQLRSGLDLEQQLRHCGASLAAVHEATAFELTITGTARPLSPPVQEELCAIAQEALRNAFQHAHASKVTARIAYGDDALVLTVADNGRGLDDEEVRQRLKDRHFGLVGMRERARRVGAALEIGGAAGQGTVVELKVPARLVYAEAL